eukprot:4778623-Amphidinium_carterae.1
MDGFHCHCVLKMVSVFEESLERSRKAHHCGIRCRFVDTWKGELVRSRIENGCTGVQHRPHAKLCSGPPKLVFAWVISVAFMHAALPPEEEIYATPPKAQGLQ